MNLYLTGIVSQKRRGIPPQMIGKKNEVDKGHFKAMYCHDKQFTAVQYRGDQASQQGRRFSSILMILKNHQRHGGHKGDKWPNFS